MTASFGVSESEATFPAHPFLTHLSYHCTRRRQPDTHHASWTADLLGKGGRIIRSRPHSVHVRLVGRPSGASHGSSGILGAPCQCYHRATQQHIRGQVSPGLWPLLPRLDGR